MFEDEVKPCTVCGKEPKIHRNYVYETLGLGSRCTIQCKPLFHKEHKRVQCSKAPWSDCLGIARALWNASYEAEIKENGKFDER